MRNRLKDLFVHNSQSKVWELYQQYAAKVKSAVVATVGFSWGDHDLDAIVRDVFFELSARNANLPTDQSQIVRYLCQRARWRALDSARRRQKVTQLTEPMMAVRQAPGNLQLQIEIQDILDKLSTRSRAVLILHYNYGYSCEEIAEMVGVTTKTVRVRLHYARREMRRMFSSPAKPSTGE